MNKFFTLLSIFILFDFLLPGKITVEEIIDIPRNEENYYNAGQNYHYSFSVITKGYNFSITENFARKINRNEKIEFEISTIFNEINKYRLNNNDSFEVYPTRIISGLILPSLLIIVLTLAYKYKSKISTLVFVIKVVQIANFIFLLN